MPKTGAQRQAFRRKKKREQLRRVECFTQLASHRGVFIREYFYSWKTIDLNALGITEAEAEKNPKLVDEALTAMISVRRNIKIK